MSDANRPLVGASIIAASLPENRTAEGRFAPGQSGNPGGRSKAVALVRKEAEAGALAAVRRIVELVQSNDERVALAAAKDILDRVAGRARHQVEMSTDGTNRLLAMFLRHEPPPADNGADE